MCEYLEIIYLAPTNCRKQSPDACVFLFNFLKVTAQGSIERNNKCQVRGGKSTNDIIYQDIDLLTRRNSLTKMYITTDYVGDETYRVSIHPV